jgi:hypothetical protein
MCSTCMGRWPCGSAPMAAGTRAPIWRPRSGRRGRRGACSSGPPRARLGFQAGSGQGAGDPRAAGRQGEALLQPVAVAAPRRSWGCRRQHLSLGKGRSRGHLGVGGRQGCRGAELPRRQGRRRRAGRRASLGTTRDESGNGKIRTNRHSIPILP